MPNTAEGYLICRTRGGVAVNSTTWAAVLMVTVAIIIAAAFITLWMRDKGRADEVSEDPERAHTGDHLGTDARGGAADELPPDMGTERRH